MSTRWRAGDKLSRWRIPAGRREHTSGSWTRGVRRASSRSRNTPSTRSWSSASGTRTCAPQPFSCQSLMLPRSLTSWSPHWLMARVSTPRQLPWCPRGGHGCGPGPAPSSPCPPERVGARFGVSYTPWRGCKSRRKEARQGAWPAMVMWRSVTGSTTSASRPAAASWARTSSGVNAASSEL